ncbi:MAG: type II secretion system F family protein [Verrucomicrobiota bacterium]
MPLYKVIGLNFQGEKVVTQFSAANESELKGYASSQKIQVLHHQILSEQGSYSKSKNQKLKPAQVAVFCERLAPLLEMRVPLSQALTFLYEKSPDSLIRSISQEIKQSLEHMPFPEAIESCGKFPPLVSGSIKAGNDSALLPEVLNILARFYRAQVTMVSSIRNALVQPSFALVIVVCYMIFSLLFTVPNLAKMMASMNAKPSGMMALQVSQMLREYWIISLAAFLVFLYGIFTDNPFRRQLWEGAIQRFNFLREVFWGMRQTSLLYAMAILFKANVPHSQVIHYLVDIARDTPLENQLKKAEEQFHKEAKLTQALELHVDLDPDIIFALKAGHESSQLPEQTEKIAKLYEKQVLLASESIANKITPIIILLTAGLAVGSYLMTFGATMSVTMKLMRNGY